MNLTESDLSKTACLDSGAGYMPIVPVTEIVFLSEVTDEQGSYILSHAGEPWEMRWVRCVNWPYFLITVGKLTVEIREPGCHV